MKMKLIIFGCGGHARSVANAIISNGDALDILFADNNAKPDEIIMGFPVIYDYDLSGDWKYIIAVGDNNKRREIYDDLQNKKKGKCISVVSQMAYIGEETEIGVGTFIAPYAYVGPQAEIGVNTIINTGSIIEHEAAIGNHTHIAPRATICGRSKIGNNVFCGAGSTIIDNISICDDVIVGAGAVVLEDITEKGTYAGIPARRVKRIPILK